MNYINKIENECKVNRNNLELIAQTNYEILRNKLIIYLENDHLDAALNDIKQIDLKNNKVELL